MHYCQQRGLDGCTIRPPATDRLRHRSARSPVRARSAFISRTQYPTYLYRNYAGRLPYNVVPQDGFMAPANLPWYAHVLPMVISSDVDSFHRDAGYDAHYVNRGPRVYGNASSGPQIPAIAGAELRWDTPVPSEFPHGSTPSIGPSRPFDTNARYQIAAGGRMPVASGVPPICQWRQCGAHLEDTNPSGVKRHLRTHHGITRAECERHARGECQWHIDGRPCGAPLDFSSFSKHVSTVHLKATARMCVYCGRRIGRADSLTRHLRDHCPVRLGGHGLSGP